MDGRKPVIRNVPFLAGTTDHGPALDSSFEFDLCPMNVPPVTFDCITDTVFLRVGDVADFNVSFVAPEFTQSTSISVNSGGLANLTTLNNSSGNMARYTGRLIASNANIGTNTITLTATDNGTPAQTVSVRRVFHIDQATGIQQNNNSSSITFSPNPFTDQTTCLLYGLNGKDVSMSIVDITGREVMRTDHVQSSMIIEKGNLMKGIYIVHLSDGTTINETEKLIIQ